MLFISSIRLIFSDHATIIYVLYRQGKIITYINIIYKYKRYRSELWGFQYYDLHNAIIIKNLGGEFTYNGT